jgi:hypothetical protein
MDLQKLQPAKMDPYGRPECQPDTRVDVLKFITGWLAAPSKNQAQNVLWLHGIAGSGKSTVATTVAKHFRELRRLGAFLFFDRKAGSDPSRVIPTLAYRLGSYDPRIGAAISGAISGNSEILTGSLSEQFSELLLGPLLSLEAILCTEGPIVVVMDALDECGTSQTRKVLLNILVEYFKKLPSYLRIFVTSRPLLDITSKFHGQRNICDLEFQMTTESNQKDIISYFCYQLAMIRDAKPLLNLGLDWPGEENIQALSIRSAALFQWCSTAIKLIEQHDPEAQLRRLVTTKVHGSAEAALDALYQTALECCGIWDDEVFKSDFQAIFGVILVACQPLTHETISRLLGLEKRPALYTIQHFRSVLHFDATEPIHFIHPSFADFLSDQNRCGRDYWFIDTAQHHLFLAETCFKVMKRDLSFNICQIPTSYLCNDDIACLPDTVATFIPAHLVYSCCFWANHLQAISNHDSNFEIIQTHIRDFLYSSLLYWLEVLSILKKIDIAHPSMMSVINWIKVCNTLCCQLAL